MAAPAQTSGRPAARRRRTTSVQLGLRLRTHGGARKGAGRRPKNGKPGVPHAARPRLTGREPVHVTLRVRDHVWNLRSRRAFHFFEHALAGVRHRAAEFRVVHFSVQGNHLHLIIESTHRAALSNGMNALAARLANGLNRLMGRTGRVFLDRFHSHVLRTPREVRNAMTYAVGNFASHARRRGEEPSTGADRYSSAALPQLAAVARTWLLAQAARDRGG